jgi:TraB/PrgY/gumN family
MISKILIPKILPHLCLLAPLLVLAIPARGETAPTVLQTAQQAAIPPVEIETVVVKGMQPGPGMWRVSKGDHDLWIMGSLWPLPSDITWNSELVESIIQGSQEYIQPPRLMVHADVGFFQKITLGYSMTKAERNPDGKTLGDVLPADVYARWTVLKKRYGILGSDMERKRPMIAANALFQAAIQSQGLGQKKVVTPLVYAAIDRFKLNRINTDVTVNITDPKQAIKEASRVDLNDVACMRLTLDSIENDLPRMVANANAWARGKVADIRFEGIDRRQTACSDALTDAEFAKKRGIPNVHASLTESWVRAAEQSLERNASTFSLVPMQDIVGPDGYIARLRAKGYEISEP